MTRIEIESMQAVVKNMSEGFALLVDGLKQTAELFSTFDQWLENAKSSITDDPPAS